MTDEELRSRVVELRGQGRSPKQIAQALGVRPAVVAALVRAIAGSETGSAVEPAVVGAWVSPGWRRGLTVAGHADWTDGESGEEDGEAAPPAGLVAVLVAREHRYEKVSLAGYLVDVYCLGVKDVIGPRAVASRELSGFVERFFEGYPAAPVEAPVELARHLVWGAVEYAHGLGFEPDRGFAGASELLGPLDEPSAITFGRDGKPLFVQGPRDDAASIMRTLESSVGEGNFDFIVGDGHDHSHAARPAARAGTRAGGRLGQGEAVPGSRQWRSRNR